MPKELDERVTKVHLHAIGAELNVTTLEQAAFSGVNALWIRTLEGQVVEHLLPVGVLAGH